MKKKFIDQPAYAIEQKHDVCIMRFIYLFFYKLMKMVMVNDDG